ncbi:hypothetical protein [Halorubrum distributum]|uniref:hypothetical protein n=1 Tax=Halorubrum distributum TaxID=29283 RepID=UPI0012674174|nr:hypothetical protein [Halorubrum litoreum]
MNLPPIPAEYFVLASAILSAFIAYQSRINGIESQRERESYLKSRLEGGTHIGDRWGIKIDTVRFHEDSGFWYRKEKFLTGRISGETTVVVQYKIQPLPGNYWDHEGPQAVLDGYEVPVKHLRTTTDTDPTIANFSVESPDPQVVENFFVELLMMDAELKKQQEKTDDKRH